MDEPRAPAADPPTRSVPDPDAPDVPDRVADRFVRVSPLGRGGMGSVWRVWDTRLGRHVALKVVRADRAGPADLARFEEEARAAAALQHSGIVPVHDLGVLPDGRLWFTMQEVRGETLDRRITEVHRAWRLGRGDEGSVRRLLDALLRVCQAVAYAHAEGFVHRDLKPANLMLGPFGEVFVLDWGLAKVGARDPDPPADADPVDRLVAPGPGTRIGAITGTPSYLSPEQARGCSRDATARSDVYALGATLYDLLCERPPRVARTTDLLIAAIAADAPIRPPSAHARTLVPDEALDRICMRALAGDPAERYADAGALAEDLAAWLDGARNRERAAALVAEADGLVAEASAEAAEADRRARTAADMLAALPSGADPGTRSVPVDPGARSVPVDPGARSVPVDPARKAAAWAEDDRARQHATTARTARTRAVQTLRAALSLAPDQPEAHARLADLLYDTHRALERQRRADDAEAVAADLRLHDRDQRYAAYLSGIGALTLATTVPVEVRLHRFVERGRRLEPVFERSLGLTPLVRVPLAMGSWLLTLHRDGCEVVRYPVAIGRGEHWDGAPPGAQDPDPVWIPRAGEIGPGECYVPAGWFWAGDEDYEHTLPLARTWADGFVLQRDPVTVGAYVRYLDALVDAGDEPAALAAQPLLGDADEPLFARDDAGHFTGIRTDRRGAGWDTLPTGPDVPAVSLDWHQATAYAAWLARDGVPWRLPMEREWQKAARGADRRRYPWGDHLEPAWCRMVLSSPDTMIAPVDAYPLDVSPYGVRGLAGNVADWVADGTVAPPGSAGPRVWIGVADAPQRFVVGGTCGSGPRTCETAQRSRFSPASRAIRVGMRLARSVG